MSPNAASGPSAAVSAAGLGRAIDEALADPADLRGACGAMAASEYLRALQGKRYERLFATCTGARNAGEG